MNDGQDTPLHRKLISVPRHRLLKQTRIEIVRLDGVIEISLIRQDTNLWRL